MIGRHSAGSCESHPKRVRLVAAVDGSAGSINPVYLSQASWAVWLCHRNGLTVMM